MPSEESDRNHKKPNVLILWHSGWPPEKRLQEIQKLLREERLEKGHVRAKDSPMGLHTSSIFADTISKWQPKPNCYECYTSDARAPLDFIWFRGFKEGDCIVLTDMSWSIEVHSKADKDAATFYVCSFPTNGSECKPSSDEPPTNTATIFALSNGRFCSPPDPLDPDYDRRPFQHLNAPGSDPKLQDLVLRVGDSFSATFTCCPNASEPCAVVFGEPDFSREKNAPPRP